MTSRHRTELAALLLGSLLWSAGAMAQAQATSDVRPAAAGSTVPATTASAQAAPAPSGKNTTEPAGTGSVAPAHAASTDTSNHQVNRETAKAALSAPKPDKLRPTGAISVTADRAELVQGDFAIYTGHVVLSSDTVTMNSSRLELRQHDNGQFVATLTGTPAKMVHRSTGPEDPSVTAHADKLVYNSNKHTITLTKHARLTRGKNTVTGQQIRYNVKDHRVQATGGSSGQVRMVIQPPPPANKAQDAKP